MQTVFGLINTAEQAHPANPYPLMRDVRQKTMNTKIESLVHQFAGARLPADYFEFLCRNLVGSYVGYSFTVPHSSGDWEDEVERFYDTEEVIDALEQEQMLRDGGAKDIPDAMIPIASNGSGDILYLSLRSTELGSVYFGFHEELDLDSGSEKGLIMLSPSFSAWIAEIQK